MFESILEKYLLNNFGQFISGLDRSSLHLGIWSGNIVIENVNIKPSLLEMLNIPLILKFSSIGKLQLQIPWSKLSSSPVEILLERVLIIAYPKDRKEWKFQDFNDVKRKLSVINVYAKNLIENYLKKKEGKKESKKEEGFFDKMTMKILDNIQLTIKSIHFRFEDEFNRTPFSFGLTLDEISVITADENWNKSFIDRTEQKGKEKAMFKLLRLKQLAVYWNSKEVIFYGNSEKEEIISKMAKMILKKGSKVTTGSVEEEYVIEISAEAKLIQNNKFDFKVPNYLLTIMLDKIDLHLKNEQLEQLIRSFEIYVDYTKMMTIERKKVLEIDQETKAIFLQEFLRLFPLLQKSEEKSLEIFPNSDQILFERILTSLSPEELLEWTKTSVKKMQKETKIQELEKIKKKNESWWGWGGGGTPTSQNDNVTEEEMREVEHFIESQFLEGGEGGEYIRPEESPWLQVNFSLEGGSVYLSKRNMKGDQEGVKLKSSCFQLVLLNYYNGLSLNVKLNDIGIDMITEYAHSKYPIITPILYRRTVGNKSEKNVKEGGHFLQCIYEKNPYGRPEDYSIDFFMDAIELIYHPLAFTRVSSFFDVKTKNEAFKAAAWDKLEKLSDTTQERVSSILTNSLKLKIKVDIIAPIIIIPFLHNNDLDSQCWLIDLGQCGVSSLDSDIKEYDRFNLQLVAMQMIYFPQRRMINSFLKQKNDKDMEELENNEIFYVIKKYNINLNILKLKGDLLNDPIRSKIGLPELRVRIDLPEFQINLNKKIYKDLIHLPDIAFLSDVNNFELLQTEKLSLLNSQIKSGSLKRRGKAIKAWHNYYVILAGGYLYFFQNQKDLVASFYLYIRKAQVFQTDLEISNEKFSFMLAIKGDEYHLACDSSAELNEWLSLLHQNSSLEDIPDPSMSKPRRTVIARKSIEIPDKALLNEVLIEMSFCVKRFSLNFYEENSKQENTTIKIEKNEKSDINSRTELQKSEKMKKNYWLHLKLKDFELNYIKKPLDFVLKFKISKLNIEDYLYNYENPEFKKLVSNSQEADIEFQMRGLEKEHSEYGGIDLLMGLKVGDLIINWKPTTLLKLGEYIAILKNYNTSKKEAEIVNDEFDSGYLKSNEDLKSNRIRKKFVDTKEKEKILLKANFQISHLTINFLHRQTHAGVAKLIIKNSLVELNLKNLLFRVNADFGNLQLMDLSNYPKTIDSNKNYKELNEYELFGGIGEKSSFKLEFLNLDNRCPDIVNNISNYFSLEIGSILLKYQQQVVMRIIDYALIQIVSLITDPKYLTLNEQFYEMNIDKELFQPKKFVGGLAEVNFKIKYPTFLDLEIKFKNSIILLKPTPDSQDYLEVTVDKLVLENEQYIDNSKIQEDKAKAKTKEFKETKRREENEKNEASSMKEESKNELIAAEDKKGRFERLDWIQGLENLDIWCERYKIVANDLHIYLSKDGNRSEIAIPVGLNLQVEKTLSYNEMSWLMEQRGSLDMIDNSFVINGLLSPIILKLYRDEYLFIIKTIFHNITFDDGEDRLFIYDFAIVSKYEPSAILFQLDFLNITVFSMHNCTHLPFSSLSASSLRLKWKRDPKHNIDFFLFGQSFSSNYFDLFEPGYLIEKGFIGSLEQEEIHEVSEKNERTASFNINHFFYKRYIDQSRIRGLERGAFWIDGLKEEKAEMTVKLLMTDLGEKAISVVFQEVKLLAQSSVYMNLFYFVQLDDSVYPKIEQNNTLAMSINCEIRNAIVCIPIKHSKKILVSKGDINARYYRHRVKNLDLLLNEYYQNKNQPNIRENIDSYSYSIDLTKVEIFLCEIDELVNLKFNLVKKRSIILPFTFFYGAKVYISLPASKHDFMYYICENECNMQETILRFSIKDALLLYQMIKYQNEEFSKIEKWKEVNEQKNEELRKQNYFDQDKTYSLTIQKLQICIINDLEEAYIPVLDITFHEGQITILKRSKLVLRASLSMSAYYFNPYVSFWEPFIETVNLHMDYNYSDKINPKNYIVVQMNDKYREFLDINVSLDMLKILQKTINFWMNSTSLPSDSARNLISARSLQPEESKELKESILKSRIKDRGLSYFVMEDKINEEDIEVVEFVSPYTIKNETGYPIEIERDNKQFEAKSKHNLPNGHSMNFQFETDMESIFNKEGKNRTHKKIKIRILSQEHNYQPIDKIDLDLIRTKRFEVSKEKSFQLPKDIILTSISFLGSGKLLTISSELSFVNRTNRKIEIKLIHNKEVSLNWMIESGGVFVVPFDKIHQNFCFKFAANELLALGLPDSGPPSSRSPWSDVFSLDKFLKKLKDDCYETSHDNFHTLVKIVKENGKSYIIFEPPFKIKNCLPLEFCFQVFFDVNQKGKQPLALWSQAEYQEHEISIGNRLYFKFKIQGFKWSEKILIYSPTINNPKFSQLILEDNIRGFVVIELMREESEIEGDSKIFYIFSKFYAINETPYNLNLSFGYYHEKKRFIVPGQVNENLQGVPKNKNILLGVPSKLLFLTFNNDLQFPSREINLNGVGSYSIEITKSSADNKIQLFEFGIDLSNICVESSRLIFSKIIRVSPRYILVNRTKFNLDIAQEACHQQGIHISPDERKHFFWCDVNKNKFIKISLIDEEKNESWGPSGSLDITNLGVVSFCLRSIDSLVIKYMQADIIINSHIIYVIITECKLETANYLIVNDLPDVKLLAYQRGCSRIEAVQVLKNSYQMFGWDLPISDKVIQIEFEFEDKNYAAEPACFDFDKMDSEDFARRFEVSARRNSVAQNYRFMVSTFIEGSTKKLRFFNDVALLERVRQADRQNLLLQVNLKEMGISLIGEYNKKRVEIIYLYLGGVELAILESHVLRTTQMRIKYINVDNTISESTMYPVAFTPTRLEDIRKKENKFHFDICVEQNIMAKNILLFKSIRILLQPCTAKVTDELIDVLVMFFKESLALFDSQRISAPISFVQKYLSSPDLHDSQSKLIPDFEWQTTELPSNVRYVYIGEIILSPIYLNASFQKKPKSQKTDPFFVMTFLNALGIALTNIDDAPINLNGIKLYNFFDTISGILTKLEIHYKEALINSLFQVIGSIDILGNPFGLMKHLAQGVFDLVDKPIEGFVKGPLEGGVGIAKGGASLLKNTVAGTFNSVQKITGSVATGISSLSLDDEYLAQREKKKMKKPKHLLDGLSQGTLSIYSGLEEGITGILTKPYEGAKKSGFFGFVKGSVHGIVGLMVKPIAGVFDATSKTAEGIKNTATHFDDKPNERRMRMPRVFYEKEGYIKVYSEQDAEIMQAMLNDQKEKTLQKSRMVGNFPIKDDKSCAFLTFFEDCFCVFDSNRIQFLIKIKNIYKCELENHGIRISLKKETKKLQNKEVFLKINKHEEKLEILELLQRLVEANTESIFGRDLV